MTEPAFSVSVDSEELARIMSNALAFFPARSPVKVARLRFTSQRISATATDTYTIGRDWLRCDTGVDEACYLQVELDRAGWQAIEETARKDKKDGYGRLDYYRGDCLVFTPSVNEYKRGKTVTPLPPATAQDMTGRPWEARINGLEGAAFWDMCDDLLQRLDGETRAFDPDYLGRFGKVRLSNSVEAEKVLDLHWQGQTEPMLAKIGPTFVGAIMPIDREVYVEKHGQAGLW